MPSTTRILSVALAGALVIAACGADEEAGTTATSLVAATDATTETTEAVTETTEAVPETTEPAQDVDADTAAAEAALLTVADFPEGWTEAPAEGVATQLDGALAACLELDGDRITAADASAFAGEFIAPTATLTVDEHIGVQPTERDARAVVARAAVPDVPACFALAYAEVSADLIGAGLGEGAQLGAATVERLTIGSFGDATQAFRVVVPVTADPAVTTVTIDHVLIRSGRSVVTLTFENSVEATPVETLGAVAGAAVARLAS